MERSLENGETPEFVGSAIVALASDGGVMKKTGRILLTSDLSHEYGFVDIDGGLIYLYAYALNLTR